MAVVAGASSSAIVQLAIASSALFLVLLMREDAPWSRSVGFYLALAAFVVIARVLFRIVFNIQDPSESTAISLPQLTLNLGFGPEVKLFGAISFEALSSGATDGLRLAAIILSIGMASSLANPRRLLKATPSALYEIASSISVAINLAPQLIASLQRVRRARALRGRSRGIGSLASTVIPVLEDAIESSLQLAASMDSRGFGRRGEMTKRDLLWARGSSLAAVAFLIIGSFVLLVGARQGLGFLVIALGLIAGYLTVKLNSKARIRTRYQPEVLGLFDYLLLSTALVLVGVAIFGVIA